MKMTEFNLFCLGNESEYCACLEEGVGLTFHNSAARFVEIESWLQSTKFACLFGVTEGTDLQLKGSVIILPKNTQPPNKEFTKHQAGLNQKKSAYQIQKKPARYQDGEKST